MILKRAYVDDNQRGFQRYQKAHISGNSVDLPWPENLVADRVERGDGMDMGQVLASALEMLPEEQRRILSFRYESGMNFRGLKRELGMSDDEVRGLLSEARCGLEAMMRMIGSG